MDRLLSLREPPTAVFAYSDEVAMGALRSLRRAHVAVPDQMSIIGVDDHPMAELIDLTTVHQPVEAQGAIAGQMVLDLLHGRTSPDRQITVPTYLVVRGSTAPPPSGEAEPPAASTLDLQRGHTPLSTGGELAFPIRTLRPRGGPLSASPATHAREAHSESPVPDRPVPDSGRWRIVCARRCPTSESPDRHRTAACMPRVVSTRKWYLRRWEGRTAWNRVA